MLHVMKRLALLRTSLLRTAVCACVLLWPTIAFAQQEAPESPTLSRGPHPIIGFGVMFVLLALLMAISLMPSKRGHQD